MITLCRIEAHWASSAQSHISEYDVARDRHIRRGKAEYFYALAAMLPQGLAWPRDPDSVLMRVVKGLSGIWERVDSRAADLLERESDPRRTIELLPDWENAWGLPDHCIAEPLSVGERQAALVQKMTLKGGQSRQFFIDLAASIGYHISIREYAPWMFGVSCFGRTRDDTGTYWRWEIAPPEIRFNWTVTVDQVRVTWWRFGFAQFGVDPHVRLSLATDLECLFRRYKPAHTRIIFQYVNNQYLTLTLGGVGGLFADAQLVLGQNIWNAMRGAGAMFAAPVIIRPTVVINGTSDMSAWAPLRMPVAAAFSGTSGWVAAISHLGKVEAEARWNGSSSWLVSVASQPRIANALFEGAGGLASSNVVSNDRATARMPGAGTMSADASVQKPSLLLSDDGFLLLENGNTLELS